MKIASCHPSSTTIIVYSRTIAKTVISVEDLDFIIHLLDNSHKLGLGQDTLEQCLEIVKIVSLFFSIFTMDAQLIKYIRVIRRVMLSMNSTATSRTDH